MGLMDHEVVDNKTGAHRKLPMWIILLAFLILAVFMALIGWGLSRSMRGALQLGNPAPAFELKTFDGQSIKTADYSGKVIVTNFWASWCQPCEAEARELEAAYQHFQPAGDVIFLGLAYVDTEPNSLAYLEKFNITYPNGPDMATMISQQYGVRGVPETFIIDRQGNLAYFKSGPFSTTEEIVSIIEEIRSR
jgi:cytochrome c biogenesis protein CcmG/thiol:disulfide interchange protein DsbE